MLSRGLGNSEKNGDLGDGQGSTRISKGDKDIDRDIRRRRAGSTARKTSTQLLASQHIVHSRDLEKRVFRPMFEQLVRTVESFKKFLKNFPIFSASPCMEFRAAFGAYWGGPATPCLPTWTPDCRRTHQTGSSRNFPGKFLIERCSDGPAGAGPLSSSLPWQRRGAW